VWPRTSDELRRPGAVEQAYVRTPVRAAQSMTRLRRIVRADLGRVEQPTLIFTSRTDPIVDPADSGYVLEHISSRDRHQEILEQSGHTATLDLDAESIFSHSRKFVERLRR
jgi:carboxylesterase